MGEERWYSPEGRIRRSTWAARVFGGGLVVGLTVALMSAVLPEGEGGAELALLPTLALVLGFVVFRIIQDVKRLHDLGRSGWFVVFAFVPAINFLYLIFVLFVDGQPHRNEYGPDPKGRDGDDMDKIADVFR